MKEFNWDVDLSGAQAEHDFKARVVTFGDGYEQRQPRFLKRKQSWSVQMTGTGDELQPVKDFLDGCRGVEAFYWQPPRTHKMLVKVSKYTRVPLGNDVWRMGWTFEEVYA